MRLSGFKLPLESLRSHQIAAAIRCPEQFRRKHLLSQEESRSVDIFLGSVDHSVMEENFDWKILTGVDMDEKILVDRHLYHWNHKLKHEPPNWGDKDQEKLFGMSQLMSLTYLREAAPSVTPIKTEIRVEERIPGVPILIQGTIDVLTETEIIERKTNKGLLKKPKTDWLLSARIYQLLVPKPVRWHVITKQVTPQVIFDEPGLTMPRSNVDHTVRMIKQTIERLNDLYQRYGPDQPWPTDGLMHDWRCDYCQFGPRSANDCIAWSTTKGVS